MTDAMLHPHNSPQNDIDLYQQIVIMHEYNPYHHSYRIRRAIQVQAVGEGTRIPNVAIKIQQG